MAWDMAGANREDAFGIPSITGWSETPEGDRRSSSDSSAGRVEVGYRQVGGVERNSSRRRLTIWFMKHFLSESAPESFPAAGIGKTGYQRVDQGLSHLKNQVAGSFFG
jgi:hypothetical protein